MDRHLIYHGGVTPQSVRNVETLIVAAMADGADACVLHLCSGGGDVNAGVGLFNFIKAVPIRVDTHAMGIVGSIAATIFMAGEHRTAAPLGGFLLHAATYSEGPRLGQIAENTALIREPFRTEAGWTEAELDEAFTTEDYRLSPVEAVGRRLAHKVEVRPLPSDARQIITVAIVA